MGCLLSGYLAESGNEVVLLDWREDRVQRLSSQGILIEGIRGEHRVNLPITAKVRDLEGSDWILVWVKAYDTKKAAVELEPLKKGKTCLLTLQNGIGNVEALKNHWPVEQIAAGITSQGATVLSEGRIRHAGAGDTVIGWVKPRQNGDKTLAPLFQALEQIGFPARLVGDVEGILWSKLLVNVGINALTALTRLRNGRLIQYAGTEAVLTDAVREGHSVGLKKGISFIYEDPLDQVKKVCRNTSENISSMLQDMLKGKRTEIAQINGAIVREGQRLEIPTPVNRVLTDLVRTLEESRNEAIEKIV
jgi:2-dehydropantoate 2-reductase